MLGACITSRPSLVSQEEREMARNASPGHVILLHPLYLRHGFAFCDKNFRTFVCPAMNITRFKLEKAFEMYSKKDEKTDIDFKSAFLVK